jgi:hypothetical protein
MSLAHKITALLTGLTPNQLEAMSPVDRQRLVDQCKPRLQSLTLRAPHSRGGVLADLQIRCRDE